MRTLSITRYGDESWRNAVERYAKAYEVDVAVLQFFDDLISEGETPSSAALEALDEWELLDNLEVLVA